jgi:membrane protein
VSVVARLREAPAGIRSRRPGVDHAVVAWRRMQDAHGSQFAGALTFFSFIALFPLLLLVASIAAYVLNAHPAALHTLLDHIAANVPGGLGKTLASSVETTVRSRTSVGLIGLVGLVFTGLGWVVNLRAAINAMWRLPLPKRNVIVAKLVDLVLLVGLGIGLVLSIAVTAIGTALTDSVLMATHAETVGWLRPVIGYAGMPVALLGDVVLFWWVQATIPATDVPKGAAFRGAVLSALGFEVLKVVGTYTIARTAHRATLGPFAGLLAVLIWLQLVSRFLLYCTAWTATRVQGADVGVVAPPDEPPPPAEPKPAPPAAVAPDRVGRLGLVGVGALLGAMISVAVRSRRGPGQRERELS